MASTIAGAPRATARTSVPLALRRTESEKLRRDLRRRAAAVVNLQTAREASRA
jgi:hypothetical protein